MLMDMLLCTLTTALLAIANDTLDVLMWEAELA